MEVVMLDAESGRQIQQTSHRWFRVGRLSWTPDGGGLVMMGSPGSQFTYQLWYLSYPDGEARRISNDLNNYQSLSLTADGKKLVTVQTATASNIWVAPASNPNAAKQITSGTGTSALWLSWTPAGKIVYGSNASGDQDLWIVGTEGRSPKQLTANARVNMTPSVSPDGRSVAFTTDRAVLPHIWKINIDGSNPQRLTDGEGEAAPFWSPDGRWIYYTSIVPFTGKNTIWRIPSEGGASVQITDKSSQGSVVSPDGKLISCVLQETDNSLIWKIGILPAQGGAPLKLLPISPMAETLMFTAYPPFQWSRDGKSLVYVENRNGVSNLWNHPLDGSSPTRLTSFQADLIFSFAWSPDGTQLAMARGTSASDAILISNGQ
jgi:Tol biopolymer transport system component